MHLERCYNMTRPFGWILVFGLDILQFIGKKIYSTYQSGSQTKAAPQRN